MQIVQKQQRYILYIGVVKSTTGRGHAKAGAHLPRKLKERKAKSEYTKMEELTQQLCTQNAPDRYILS